MSTLSSARVPLETVDSIQSLIDAGYSALNYSAGISDCLRDDAIRERLSELPLKLYNEFLPLQDQRLDKGHVNTVVHFTLEVAKLLKLNPQQTDSAVIAAICHDIGWSTIENISEIFSNNMTRQQRGRLPGGDTHDADLASQEEKLLRVLHQDRAVELAGPWLQNHPDRAEILKTIGDHDTRKGQFSHVFSSFLDADWLWRVTLPVIDSGSAGKWERNNPQFACDLISTTPLNSVFLNPISQSIARLEAANTVLELQRRYNWPGLPESFKNSFAPELSYFATSLQQSLPMRVVQEDHYSEVLSAEFKRGTLAELPRQDLKLPEEYLQKLSDLFPDGISASFLNSWHQALHNSDMPLNFAAAHSYEEFPLDIDGEIYRGIKTIGIDHIARGEIINSKSQYQPIKSLDQYGLRLSGSCMLDFNIAQALDAGQQYSETATNALADFGEFILLVNKFPYNVTDTLLLPKNHDLLDQRAQYDKNSKVWTKHKESDTRGAIIDYRLLATVIALCDRLDLAAQRNHALDGMSVPLHDHFKLVANAHPTMSLTTDFLRTIELNDKESVSYRATNTPFDTLCLTSRNHNQLAHDGAKLLEILERADQIFTIVYAQGTLLITPRRMELYGNGNKEGWTGSTVGIHGIEDPQKSPVHLERVLRFTPRQGEFNWKSFLDRAEIKLYS
jgi:hypothetical protein